MYISKVTILNYKSFFDSSELVFRPGFNVIIGQNSSGKTALLEALSLTFPFVPHRSVRTIPTEGGTPAQISEIDVSVTVSAAEIMEWLFQGGAGAVDVALPALDFGSTFAIAQGISDPKGLVDWFLGAGEHTFKVRLSRLQNTQQFSIPSSPSYGQYQATPIAGGNLNFMRFTLQRDRRIAITQTSVGQSKDTEIGMNIAPMFPRYVYLFKAERFNLARCQYGGNEVLSSDASNLPEVLNKLQGNRERYSKFIAQVRSVLPQIKDVTILPDITGRLAEIKVWTSDLSRVDLAKPLDACGTGIGQALAILYVAINSPHPRVILIDEPQSFLHPGAARKLIQILRNYPQHQYICSTHSAAIISSAEPETITLTRLNEDRTEVVQVDPGERESLQTCLAEVGARLADVFGADRILWVEGRTEETSFPIILHHFSGRALMGTVIVGVRSTGELEGGDAQRILGIYSRLSSARSLMPPALGFIFDQEGRTREEREDIGRRTGPSVRFLPRRMYENYLLDARAISTVLSVLDAEHSGGHSPEAVQTVLDSERQKIENFKPLTSVDGPNWRSTINAYRVLKVIFGRLSDQRVRYDKVRDGEALTKELLANNPEQLQDVAEFLLTVLPSDS